ncbi:hypothetical protein R1flu_013736 [Riccia fluitans]|uniref:SGF29 C-terminal domain-containing protein n=1 Tax=Riccia fluitans TaxID=41844 RepID=A0ABD1YEV6_9MARC
MAAVLPPYKANELKLVKIKELQDEQAKLYQSINKIQTKLSAMSIEKAGKFGDEFWHKLIILIEKAKSLADEEAKLSDEVKAFITKQLAETSSGCDSPRMAVSSSENDSNTKQKTLSDTGPIDPEQKDVQQTLPLPGSQVFAIYPGTSQYCKADVVGFDSPESVDAKANYYLLEFINDETVEARVDGTPVWKVSFDDILLLHVAPGH